MCAINASPEAGDASTGIMSARRKYSAISGTEGSKHVFLSQQHKNLTTRYTSMIPLNPTKVKDSVCDKFAVIQNKSLQRMNNIEREVDYCEFPYYRSNRTDAVLIKDVGVSCNLLSKNMIDHNIPISEIESYLVKQLKLEYNELSSITKKINVYTKDILNSLASRCKKEDQIFQKLHVASNHVMASQYTDKIGNPCLKLRFCDDIEKNQSSEIAFDKNFAENEIVKEETHGNRNMKKRRVETNKTFPKGALELSPKCSGVLLRNYLITKKGKVSGNASKASLRKVENFASSGRLCKNRSGNKSRESFYTSKCNPLVLTSWKEVSRRKDCRSKNACIANTSGEP
ncbi:uncharacterized protein [Linepithema humile]